MRYEEPEMEVIILNDDDICTQLSTEDNKDISDY